jgi:hypothetical protein
MKNLKLYVQDRGVYGMSVVTATCLTDAEMMMRDCDRFYDPNEEVTEHAIEHGFHFSNGGDS